MRDGIIKADGTSRRVKANFPPTYEAFRAQAAAGTLSLDVLFQAAGWSQQPTFLNKASLLADQTAEKIALGIDATPNDALNFFSNYNLHWWRRRQNGSAWSPSFTDYAANREVGGFGTWAKYPISYSDELTYESDGTMSLLNPVTVAQPQEAPTYLKGKYFTVTLGGGRADYVYYAPADASATSRYDSSVEGDYYFVYIDSYIVKAVYTEDVGDWSLIFDANRNAYPDGGIVDGYEYGYCGIPLQNAVLALVELQEALDLLLLEVTE